MRYCKECSKIHYNDGNVCECGNGTEDIGLSDQQLVLFEQSDIDLANSLYTDLKLLVDDARTAVEKAEAAVRRKNAELQKAYSRLIKHDRFIKGKGIMLSAEESFTAAVMEDFEGAQETTGEALEPSDSLTVEDIPDVLFEAQDPAESEVEDE